MSQSVTRRQTLAALTASVGATLSTNPLEAMPAPAAQAPFTICLNMSTIRGQKLGFVKELEAASKGGFRSVEIWIETLQTYLKNGGTTAEARRILKDNGIKIENAIGFAPWIIDDEAARAKGLAQLKSEMEMLAEVAANALPRHRSVHNLQEVLKWICIKLLNATGPFWKLAIKQALFLSWSYGVSRRI